MQLTLRLRFAAKPPAPDKIRSISAQSVNLFRPVRVNVVQLKDLRFYKDHWADFQATQSLDPEPGKHTSEPHS